MTANGAAGPEFSAHAESEAGRTVIHEIDLATAGRLRDAVEPHVGPEQTIVLDLSEVEFMDSQALRVLVQARGQLTADGGSLILRNPSVAARRLLTAARVQVLLEAIEEPGPAT